MGTRADFYIGRGRDAKWLCSIAWDGYPGGIDAEVLTATTEEEYLAALAAFTEKRTDVTKPDQGWPWPWEDSRTTDYAYALDGGKVWSSRFGRAWVEATREDSLTESEEEALEEQGKCAEFPDMTDIQNVTLGPRSGVLLIGPKR